MRVYKHPVLLPFLMIPLMATQLNPLIVDVVSLRAGYWRGLLPMTSAFSTKSDIAATIAPKINDPPNLNSLFIGSIRSMMVQALLKINTLILVLSLVNFRGIWESVRVNVVLTLAEVLALALFVVEVKLQVHSFGWTGSRNRWSRGSPTA
jgi:hypothetical protein